MERRRGGCAERRGWVAGHLGISFYGNIRVKTSKKGARGAPKGTIASQLGSRKGPISDPQLGKIWTSRTHLLWFSGPLDDPRLDLIPGLVQDEQSGLSSALDELIRFRDEFLSKDPFGEFRIGGDGVGEWIPGYLCDLGRWIDEFCCNFCRRIDWSSALEPVSE